MSTLHDRLFLIFFPETPSQHLRENAHLSTSTKRLQASPGAAAETLIPTNSLLESQGARGGQLASPENLSGGEHHDLAHLLVRL